MAGKRTKKTITGTVDDHKGEEIIRRSQPAELQERHFLVIPNGEGSTARKKTAPRAEQQFYLHLGNTREPPWSYGGGFSGEEAGGAADCRTLNPYMTIQ